MQYSNMEYSDIKDQITILDESAVSILSAYTENGIVAITLILKVGVKGSIDVAQVNTQFAPRKFVGGIYTSFSASEDLAKIPSLYIDEQGIIRIWFAASLSYNERSTFIYPKKG